MSISNLVYIAIISLCLGASLHKSAFRISYPKGICMEHLMRPEIALDQFLPIFTYSTLVMLFGVGYAAAITLSKMGFFSKKWHLVGYLMWALQAFSLYKVSVLIHSDHFTTKVLMITMVAYLFIPHLYYMLIVESEKRYEHNDSSE